MYVCIYIYIFIFPIYLWAQVCKKKNEISCVFLRIDDFPSQSSMFSYYSKFPSKKASFCSQNPIYHVDFPMIFPMDPMVQEWWIASNLHLDGSMKAVLSALAVTAVAFVVIFCLDKVAEPWRIDHEFIGINQPFPVMAGKHGIFFKQNPRFHQERYEHESTFLLADGC